MTEPPKTEGPGAKPPAETQGAGLLDAARVAAADREGVQRIFRSLQWRVFLILAGAILAVFAAGALLLLVPLEYALFGVPALLVAEFLFGFLLSGKLLALALARHHERLRDDLLRQQEETKKTLVDRWRSLDSDEREQLRKRFPDVDWTAIDGLAGTGAEPETKH